MHCCYHYLRNYLQNRRFRHFRYFRRFRYLGFGFDFCYFLFVVGFVDIWYLSLLVLHSKRRLFLNHRFRQRHHQKNFDNSRGNYLRRNFRQLAIESQNAPDLIKMYIRGLICRTTNLIPPKNLKTAREIFCWK